MKNNTVVIVKNTDTDNTSLIISALAVAGGVITILIGLQKWITEQRQNRASRDLETIKDIVLPLIFQFDRAQGMFYAKQILDGFTPPVEHYWAHPKEHYNTKHLDDILRDHNKRRITDPGEIAIRRRSFDELLDFFAKLEYYFQLAY